MSTWGTLRVDAIGSVARPLTRAEVDAFEPYARAVNEKRLPLLALLAPVLYSLGRGTSPRRSNVAARSVGPISSALVAMLVLDARDPASRAAVRKVLRSLDAPSLDAVEDLLSIFPAVHPLVEVERMYRAGLLDGDWTLVLDDGAEKYAPGYIPARIVATARTPADTA